MTPENGAVNHLAPINVCRPPNLCNLPSFLRRSSLPSFQLWASPAQFLNENTCLHREKELLQCPPEVPPNYVLHIPVGTFIGKIWHIGILARSEGLFMLNSNSKPLFGGTKTSRICHFKSKPFELSPYLFVPKCRIWCMFGSTKCTVFWLESQFAKWYLSHVCTHIARNRHSPKTTVTAQR